MARSWARWESAAAGRSRTSNAPRPASAQSDSAQRLVDRARSTEPAAIQDQLVRAPRVQFGRRRKIWQRRAVACPRPRQREVGVEPARLRLQARALAFLFHLGGQRSNLLLALSQAHPP